MIRNAKKLHFEVLFLQSQGSQKKTWKLINSFVGKHQKSSQPSEMIGQDGIMVNDENEIADVLNHHFVSIGEKQQIYHHHCQIMIPTVIAYHHF